mmetsp:Transcript_16008/g.28865  ORF Transcript_16008/g.28865 Transcript_16008/m.28865 type:complete len:219 (+) Transcript_16008:72-728(+)|eukprot:CAMPEP_0196129684 /NCGR_PEP_ID=MMETSP0910-20130528/291_1 /TAXON_ID=49265 /ORGANISM="Thalassiosira rotula, Strain GSO102" /LENGTH=218 /DNA_ID=CAMNT_0041388831 /DNA_START=40 /DNA_END=696 /DNA_ORIENTATION=-
MKSVLFAFLAITSSTDAFSVGSQSTTRALHHGSTTQLMATNNGDQILSRRRALSSFLTAGAAVMTSALVTPDEAQAAEGGSRAIGKIAGSGLVFKDTLTVESFDDPKVKGVTLYVSNFERPMTERISKDFFTEPSYASVTAVRNGNEIEISDDINKTEKGESVFEEKRSLLFKELRVQRIYDVEKNTLVYVSFNTRLNKDNDPNNSRFKSSISAVPLN